MDIEKLNKGLDDIRIALGLPDDLPVPGCKEPEYAGGRARVLRALIIDRLIDEKEAEAWFRVYVG